MQFVKYSKTALSVMREKRLLAEAQERADRELRWLGLIVGTAVFMVCIVFANGIT